jgi:flagellar protein FliJ
MDHILPLLIERAAALRDRQAAAMQQARMAADQADTTLGRLESFRVDCLARSPAGSLARTTADSLAGHQQFVSRLDDAIGLQTQEADTRHARAGEQQAVLIEAQRRLLAFETLQRRRAAERNAKEQRKLQRESDEFAARAARRNNET